MFDLLPDEDQRMIAETVRRFLEGEMPLERLRPGNPSRDPASDRKAMGAMGWFALGLPETAGGSGLGLAGEMIVQRECGRQIVSPAMLATVLAVHVAHDAGDSKLCNELGSGAVPVALGLLPSGHGCDASLLDWDERGLVLAWNQGGMGLFDGAALSQVEREDCLDDSVALHSAAIDLDRAVAWVPAHRVNLALRADVLLAAALAGLAENVCDITVAYVKLREQFGRPIGSFQAVKHRCADMTLRWRASWYQTCLAGLKVEAGAADCAFQSASAKFVAAQAAHQNAAAAIQMHGGIGFQSECDVHWFMKRAHLLDQAGGSTSVQARRIIAQPAPLW